MTEQQHVLIVDDEPDILELLNITLSRMGLEVTAVADLALARRALLDHNFSFCLTDMRLPDGNGLDLVREISENHPNLPAAVITAHGKVEDAVTALKSGAFDFVSKPVDLGILRRLVNTALRLRGSESSVSSPGRDSEPEAERSLEKLTGESEAIRKASPPSA